jgi:hypothetical protein
MNKLLSVLCVVTIFSVIAFGQLGTKSHAKKGAEPSAGYVGISYPTYVYGDASLGTGGLGLRNRGGGAFNVSGVTGPVQAAYLYWAVLTATATIPKAVEKVTIARLLPTGAPTPLSATVTGTLLTTAGDPCWGSYGTQIFRAAVPTTVATGNGTYKITLLKGASGLTNGADPWVSGAVFPAWEGASLVIVGSGNADVEIFDTVIQSEFYTNLEYYLDFYYFTANAANGSTVLHLIGADGQTGSSYYPSLTGEQTWENGVQIAGSGFSVPPVGGQNGDSDWDGTIAGPLPQLWDDTAHDITNLVNGYYYTYNQFNSYGDCLVPVVNAVALH